MSTHTRARTKRQLRHPASRSRSHQLDKQQGERRKETAWLNVDAPPRPVPERSFAALGAHEYTFDGQQWRRCQGPEAFADYLEAEAARRSYYRAWTTRKGVPVEMLRRMATPVEVLTTTFAPWLADWTAAQLAANRIPREQLAAIRNAWLEAAQTALAGRRALLGYAFHCDTPAAPHFDLCVSRQTGTGERIGETGLLLVGPWCVGTERQVRAGAKISPDKRRQLKRSVANFHHRYGETTVPLDVTLARALDAAADAVLGETKYVRS